MSLFISRIIFYNLSIVKAENSNTTYIILLVTYLLFGNEDPIYQVL